MAASPSSSSDDQLPLGSLLDGRYRIDAVLGTGGMGRVYRAEHTKIGKSVAIKVLHADLGRNREATQRFQREAIASGRLDHPNIVGVSDFGVLDDGGCFLVMEVLEGESLGDRLGRDHRLHWVEAIEIQRGVLHGLRHAHERGVVHRDIKPDNVYLAHKDGDPIVKILDFGIAKLYAGTEDDPASTRAGLTVGTPAYLSPEQAVGGEITPKSDLYSASILLYEMLAGRAPFEERDPLAMLGAHVSRKPPAFAEIAPGVDIPAPLEAIVQHGLMKMAGDRIATAADYLAMLDAFSPPIHALPRFATSPALVAARVAAATGGAPVVAPSGHATTPFAMAALPGSGPTAIPQSGATAIPQSGATAIPHSGATAIPHSGAIGIPHSGAIGIPHSGATAIPHSGAIGIPHSGATAIPHSGAIGVPSGAIGIPHSGAIGVPSGAIGSPHSGATAIPHSGAIGIPPSGAIGILPSGGTPHSGSVAVPSGPVSAVGVTAVLGTAGSLPVAPVSLEMPRLERAKRAVSLADVVEPIPKSWIVRSGVFVALAILGAITLAIVSHCSGGAPRPSGSSAGSASAGSATAGSAAVAPKLPAKPAKPAPPPATIAKPAIAPAPVPAPTPAQPEVAPTPAPVAAPAKPPMDPRLVAVIRELETSRTCGARKAAIPKLLALHNSAAVPALRRARYRMYGGVLGFGQDNANACLKADAERAIKALGGTLK